MFLHSSSVWINSPCVHAGARPCTGAWKFKFASECVVCVCVCKRAGEWQCRLCVTDSVSGKNIYKYIYFSQKIKRSHAHPHHRWSCEDCNTCNCLSRFRKPKSGLKTAPEKLSRILHLLLIWAFFRVWRLEAFQLNKVGLDPRPGLLWDLLEACVFRSTFFF